MSGHDSGDVELKSKDEDNIPRAGNSWCCCSGPTIVDSYSTGDDHKHLAPASQLATQVQQDQKTSEIQYKQPPMPVEQEAQDDALLPPMRPEYEGKKCLILDLDETLVHSSFTPVPNADFVISLDLQGTIHRVYVRKRPGVEEFLAFCGKHFEVAMFTASLSKYADPLLDRLDPKQNVKHRLFREHCTHYQGNYVKDLSRLGRPLKNCIIVDNSPYSYMFQRDNSIPCISWYTDKSDRQLYELIPFLKKLMVVDDVATVLKRDRLSWSAIPFDEHV